MKVKVTQSHIKRGKKGSLQSCPIALAVKEAVSRSCLPKFFGKLQGITVDCDGVNIGFEGGQTFLCTDNVINDFVALFDDGEKVKPFQLDLMF